MSVERNSSERDSISEPLEADRGSSTRIRTVRRQDVLETSAEGATLASALLAGHEAELRQLVRRLELSPRGSFLACWLEQCARSGQLARESGDFPPPIQRTAGPLLASL